MVDNEKEKPKPIDINDLSLADEEIAINSEADAFAGPPPPDDGDHLVKLSLGDRKVVQGKAKNGQDYLMVHVQAKIISGPFENRILFDNASTMIMQGSGTCRIAGIMKALGEPVPARTQRNEMVRRFVQLLAGEPQCVVTSQWKVYCPDCDKNVLRGQKRFPAANGGTTGHRHQIECSKDGSLLTANAEITAYKSVAAS